MMTASYDRSMKIKIVLLGILCVGAVVAAPFLSYSYTAETKNNDTVILTLCHIDEFEGGKGARSGYLLRRGEEFNRRYKNVFIEVKTISLLQLSDMIEEKNLPDLISFSRGIGGDVYPFLKPYRGKINVRSDLMPATLSGGEYYALPWCMGGYCLITRQSKPQNTLLIGESLYNNPYEAAKLLEKKYAGGSGRYTQYAAYESFVSEGSGDLLGTQRDIIRCAMKAEQGKLSGIEFLPIGGYSDLVQCIGVTASGGLSANYATEFISFLTEESAQSKLTEIGMLNVIGERYASGSYLEELEKALADTIRTLNVFLSPDAVRSEREESLHALGIA